MELRAVITPRWTPDDYRTRPKEYDPAVADIILERLANGEMLPAICSSDRDMPLPGTFLRWCELDPILESQYVSARRIGTEVNLDEMVIASQNKNVSQAILCTKALKDHVQLTDPARYGPRSVVRTSGEGEKEDGGIDYRAEVRRKVEALATRIGQAAPEAPEAKNGGSGE